MVYNMEDKSKLNTASAIYHIYSNEFCILSTSVAQRLLSADAYPVELQ